MRAIPKQLKTQCALAKLHISLICFGTLLAVLSHSSFTLRALQFRPGCIFHTHLCTGHSQYSPLQTSCISIPWKCLIFLHFLSQIKKKVTIF